MLQVLTDTFHLYSVFQWLMLWFLYNFFGWVYETTYVSIHSHQFENRGFLMGPQIPLYGTGALLMLFLATPVKSNLLLTYLVGMIGATILEFIVGVGMEAIFKVKYWDYSRYKTNIKGVICLPASLCWGVFTCVLVYFLHRPIDELIRLVPYEVLVMLDGLIGIIFVTDFAMSVKAAFSLRSMLEALQSVREEITHAESELLEKVAKKKQELLLEGKKAEAQWSDIMKRMGESFGTSEGEEAEALGVVQKLHGSWISRSKEWSVRFEGLRDEWTLSNAVNKIAQMNPVQALEEKLPRWEPFAAENEELLEEQAEKENSVRREMLNLVREFFNRGQQQAEKINRILDSHTWPVKWMLWKNREMSSPMYQKEMDAIRSRLRQKEKEKKI